MSEIKGIKMFYNNQMKRLNEGVKNFEELIMKASLLFKLETSQYKFKFFYLDKEEEKIEITKEEDYQEVVKYHLCESQNLMKILLEIEKINVDEMLQKVELTQSLNSETFPNVPQTVNEKVEFIQLDEKEEKVINVDPDKGKNEDDNRNLLSKSVLLPTNDVQREIPKVQVNNDLNESKDFSFVEIKSEQNNSNISQAINEDDLVKFNRVEEKVVDDVKSHKNEEIQVDTVKLTSNVATQKPEVLKDQGVLVNQEEKIKLEEENKSIRIVRSNDSNIEILNPLKNDNNTVIVNSFNEKDFLSRVDDIISKKLNNLEEKFIQNFKHNNANPSIQVEENKSIEKDESNVRVNMENNAPKLQKLDIFRQTCDICMKCPILGPKYYCILCSDLVICGECDGKHNHPVIKFNNELIQNKDQLMKMMYLAGNKEEGSLLHRLISKIENSSSMEKIQSLFKNSCYKAELTCDYRTGIIVKPGCNFILSLYLNNISQKHLPKGVKILPMNNKDLEIEPCVTDFELKPKYHIKLDIKCKAPAKNDSYKVKFIVYHNNISINSNTLIVDIVIGTDDNAKYNEFFAEFTDIIRLPKEKKKILFDVINDELSKKNPEVIRRILEKYNWRVELALDELMSE
jgi:hypothetical protein